MPRCFTSIACFPWVFMSLHHVMRAKMLYDLAFVEEINGSVGYEMNCRCIFSVSLDETSLPGGGGCKVQRGDSLIGAEI